METMRSLEVITKELSTAVDKVKSAASKLEKANDEAASASTYHDNARIEAGKLREELDTVLNLLVPSSLQARVRQS